ncbi:MAG: chromosome segregation protein SMC [Actinobacteria bacterium]|nr:chromosome segregation protein SMC [Actinomycetota bacterium]MTA89456.1 chromosome segregation protein SMC [Actinomycetota bacterium]
METRKRGEWALYLKSITLKGFKSFAQPTTLQLEPGITCVVGPNGSGKSNVVDGLAWVMGEQGPKTLRGGKMEDVIFAGSANKAPLGRAEVELVIDNSDGHLPIEYTEVKISRVLFRNGASEYAINGEICRLLDIQELLSDTGLGREMHVIVGQGQLDTVLRATPSERRAFIEEAAGILKYRRRKEKTERKLDAMQANLTRLQDLVSEVRRNLKPLGRQAEVAKQAKEIAASARELKGKLIATQLRSLRQQLDSVSKDEGDRKAQTSYAQQQLESARTGIREIENSFDSGELDSARSNLYAIEALETRIRNLTNLASQKRTLLVGDTTTSSKNEVDELNQQQTSLQQELLQLDTQLQAVAADLAQAEQHRERMALELARHEAELDRAREKAENKRTEKSQIAAQIENIVTRRQENLTAENTLRGSISETRLKLSALEQERNILDPTGQAVSDDALRRAYENAQSGEREARRRLDAAREELHRAERERDSLAARHAALGLLLEQEDGAKNVRKANLNGVGELLADAITIDSGYETAIAVALGTIADSVLVESKEQALAALRYLKRENLGRAEFVIFDGAKSRRRVSTGELPRASELVEAPEGVLDILDGFLVADSLEQAESIRSSDRPVITKDGDYISRSLIRGGSNKQPSKLELAAERDRASSELQDYARIIDQLTSKLEDAKLQLTAATRLSEQSLGDLQKHDSELAKKAESLGRVIAQLDSTNAEILRLQSELAEVESANSELASKKASYEQQLTQFADVTEVDLTARETALAALDSARAKELDVRVSLSALQERKSGVGREQVLISQRLAEALAADQARAELLNQRKQEVLNAESILEFSPKLLAKIEQLILTARTKVRELDAERGQKMQRLQQLRQQAQQLESQLSSMTQGVQEIEMRSYELRLQLQSLSDRSQEELSFSAADLLNEYQEIVETQSELETSLRQAERKLNQLGAFNPLALEEFSALEERHKYLSEQLEDLNSARADLRGIISDLDEKMEITFQEAFADTKKAFEEVFPILFPGGTGSLSLIDDPSGETGIEVAVKPVGKRIERMSLLSGGERSLAAVALLVAIFKARPSPFYVLDEVEAALDDANLGRLLSVIETLRESSQLIIVTHQKRTMEIADALYGVSMRQDGITQVVGQKLDKAS